VDLVDKATRSRMMSGIRGKNTKPELQVRRFLHALGLRYRLHAPELPGRPDLVFPKYRVAVQVQGCFWHQHQGCPLAYIPASNKQFWITKLSSNVERDTRNARRLRAMGWRVVTVWECDVRQGAPLGWVERAIRRGK
jgi:DNA mismatch endonuclease, patch repair protein